MSQRSPSLDEEACPRGESRRVVNFREGSLEGMLAQVVEGGKRRKMEVGGPIDPEKRRNLRLPVAVKMGGIRWESGIGGVQAGLMEARVEFCEGAKWLVPEGELQKRKERGSLASTVVVRIRGGNVAGQLCCTGLWVGGVWCSVRRYVVVAPVRKGPAWRKAVDEVKEAVAGGGKSVVGLMKDMREEVRRLTGVVGVAPLGKNVGDGLSGLRQEEVEEVGKRVSVAVAGLKAIGGYVDVLGSMMAVMLKRMEEVESKKEKGKGKAGGGGVDYGGGSGMGPGFRF